MSVWSKIYERINWKDLPQRLTALAARNLNKMDLAIDTLDDRTIGLNTRLEAVEENPITVDTELKPDSENPVQNKVIYAAFEDLLPEETAQGNPIVIDDASGLNAKACSVDLLPIQDLHGYDSPWVGGAGKNKLQNTATSTTINGVTFTVNSDGSVRANGTASGNAIFVINSFTFDGTSVILNGCPSGGSGSTYKLDAFGSSGLSEDIGNGVTISASGERNVRIVVFSGTTIDKVFYPMIRLSTVADGTFAPYENICPISGRTQASVIRTGKNVLDPSTIKDQTSWNTYTIQLKPNTQYTASANIPNDGVLIFYFNKENSFSSTVQVYSGKNVTITTDSSGLGYIRQRKTDNTKSFADYNLMVAEGTDDTYEPYQGKTVTIQFGQTVYGGTLDVTNGGTSDEWAKITKKLSEADSTASIGSTITRYGYIVSGYSASKRSSSICDKAPYIQNFTSEELHFMLNTTATYIYLFVPNNTPTTEEFTFCIPLATPTTITTQAEQISLLKGQNVISTDGDNIILKYSADIKAWVENQLSV